MNLKGNKVGYLLWQPLSKYIKKIIMYKCFFFKVKKASFVELQWFPFRRKKDSDTEFSLPSVYFLCMCERVYVFGSHAFTCIQRKSCLANQTNHRIDVPHIKIWKSILLEKYKHSARSKIEMWCEMGVSAPCAPLSWPTLQGAYNKTNEIFA